MDSVELLNARKDEMGDACGTYREKSKAYTVLVRLPEGKKKHSENVT
jgi:hypothetical protein